MEIALLHYAAQPVVGGVESVMGQHARLMAEAGHHVRVIAGRGTQVDARIDFSAVPLVDSRDPEILEAKRDLDTGRLPANFEDLVDRVQAEIWSLAGRADYLIAHNVCSLNKNLALTAALRRISRPAARPRLIIWHHDLAWTTPRYRAELHEGYPWDLLCTDWPDAIQVTVSEWRRMELANLLEVPPARISVVPNGIDAIGFLRLDGQTQALVRAYGLLKAEPLILLPVRVTPRKNIEKALEVLSSLRNKYPRAKLVVTGPLGAHDQANAQYMQQLSLRRAELDLQNAAVFLSELNSSPLPDPAIAGLYALADALLLPSREEGFGLPILEAGVAGVPIFCSDIETLRELGGAQASYFPPDSPPPQVAALIERALEESTSYALRKRVLRDYTWETIYARRLAPLLEIDR